MQHFTLIFFHLLHLFSCFSSHGLPVRCGMQEKGRTTACPSCRLEIELPTPPLPPTHVLATTHQRKAPTSYTSTVISFEHYVISHKTHPVYLPGEDAACGSDGDGPVFGASGCLRRLCSSLAASPNTPRQLSVLSKHGREYTFYQGRFVGAAR